MAVVCGGYHTLSIDDEGIVWAIGCNGLGQCGFSHHTNNIEKPMQIPGLQNIIEIAAGREFSACVSSTGHLFTFGANNKGQLGTGDIESRNIPHKVLGFQEVGAVTCGSYYTVFVTSANEAYGMGDNNFGQLGYISSENEVIYPTRVPIDNDILKVACGENHSVYLTLEGDVWVCGENLHGQLGIGNTQRVVSPPIRIPKMNSIKSIGCGDSHTVVMDFEHNLFVTGRNLFGNLCCEHSNVILTPQQVLKEIDVLTFSCGAFSTLVIDSSKYLWLFGTDCLPNRDPKYYCGAKLGDFEVVVVSSGHGHVLMKTIGNEIYGIGHNGNNQLALPKTGKFPYTVTHPTLLPIDPNIIGTPLERRRSRQKSARK